MSSGGRFVARSPANSTPRGSPGPSRRTSSKGKQTAIEPEHVHPIKQKKKPKKIVHHEPPNIKDLGLDKPAPGQSKTETASTTDSAIDQIEENSQPWGLNSRSPLSDEAQTPSPGFSLGEDEDDHNPW